MKGVEELEPAGGGASMVHTVHVQHGAPQFNLLTVRDSRDNLARDWQRDQHHQLVLSS